MIDDKKEQMKDALVQGVKDGYAATKRKNLSWWERLLWILGCGLAAAASSYLTGCQDAGSLAHDTYHIVTDTPCAFRQVQRVIILNENCVK